MTADLYATGLIERSAAAFASDMPEGARDDGFFGPASITWRMSADLASPVAGLRSLLMQALHPLAMAGVDQHSGWRRDPAGRLAAITAYLDFVRPGPGRYPDGTGRGQMAGPTPGHGGVTGLKPHPDGARNWQADPASEGDVP